MHLGGGPLVVTPVPPPAVAPSPSLPFSFKETFETYEPFSGKPPAPAVILSEFELLPGNEYTHAFDGTYYEAHTLQADVVHGDGVLQAWRPLAGIQIGGWQTFRVRRLDSNPWPLRVRITGVCR